MDPHALFDSGWPEFVASLSACLDLDSTARQFKAFQRARGVPDAAALLRLALVYGLSERSLPATAAWAAAVGVASLGKVSLHERLRNAAPWLEAVWQTLLGEHLAEVALPGLARVMRIIDATTIAAPGSRGTDWRLHLEYRPLEQRLAAGLISDGTTPEGFRHFAVEAGDLMMGDRAYAKAKDLGRVNEAGADVLVRIGWRSLVLLHEDGRPLDLLALLARQPRDRISEVRVQVAKGAKCRAPILAARLVLKPLPAEVAERSRKRAAKKAKRQGRKGSLPKGAIAAGFVMVLTTLPADEVTAEQVMALYRVRWQVELAFKRLKSIIRIDNLMSKSREVGKAWLAVNLIAALLLERMARELEGSPPEWPPDPDYDQSLWQLMSFSLPFLQQMLLAPDRGRALDLAAARQRLKGSRRRRKSQLQTIALALS